MICRDVDTTSAAGLEQRLRTEVGGPNHGGLCDGTELIIL